MTASHPMPFGWGRVPFDLEARRAFMDLPFPVEEYEGRMAKVRERLRAKGLDGLLVHGTRGDRGGIRYLTNFEDYYKGENLCLIPLEGEPAFVTNSIFHGEPMHSGVQNVWLRDVRCAAHPRTAGRAGGVLQLLFDLFAERGLQRSRIGLSGDGAGALKGPLLEGLPDLEIEMAEDILPEVMKIKSRREVEVLREGALILDRALLAVMANVREGVREYELSGVAMEALFSAGAEGGNFPMALSSGERAGLKHVPPTERRMKRGEMVFADLGGIYKGYSSDASRARVVGEPNPEQRHFLEAQIAIVKAVLAEARAGVRIADLAKVGIEVARRLGVEEDLYFRGHGIGTFSHVPPSIHPENEAPLEEDMVLCLEPMLIRYGFGTACVENMYHVTREGLVSLNECPWRWWK